MNKLKFFKVTAMLLCIILSLGTLLTACGTTVSTYAVSDVAYVDSWVDNSETYGDVRTFNIQTVYASETLEVLDVFVEEGQEVKKGDKLMSYDTTLTDLEVDRKKLDVMTLELELQKAEEYLKTVNSYVPMVVTTITPDVDDTPGTAVNGYMKLSGEGTEESPFIYVVEDGEIPCDSSFINAVCPIGTEEVWVVFQTRSGNVSNGSIIDYSGICYKSSISGTTMSFFEAGDFCIEEPTEPYEEVQFNSGLTMKEINQLRSEAKTSVEEAKYKYNLAELEYEQMLLEVDNGVITAELDGTIISLTDKETALTTGEPMLKLSADGGYIVEGTLSELELDTVSIGQSVTVTSWTNYSEYEAEITSISTLPGVQNGWSNGNSNVSYYPFTVYIDGSANLQENEWVSITYSSSGADRDFFYLESLFISNEGGRNYAYVSNENGELEKRAISTGEMLWGSYIKVYSGITLEDRIALPFDKNAKEGAKTVEADVSELYNY